MPIQLACIIVFVAGPVLGNTEAYSIKNNTILLSTLNKTNEGNNEYRENAKEQFIGDEHVNFVQREKFSQNEQYYSRQTRNLAKTTKRGVQTLDTLESLYTQLAILQPCNRTLESPLIRQLLSDAIQNLEKNLTTYAWLFELAPKITYLPHAKGIYFVFKFIYFVAMLSNMTLRTKPSILPVDGLTPAYGLQLLCEPIPKWLPIAVYPTKNVNTYLQCSYTVHNYLKIYARSCCDETLDDNFLDEDFPNVGDPTLLRKPRFCREDFRRFQSFFFGISCICISACFVMIFLVIRERKRQQQEARGWALIEPFFIGAIFIYAIPLLVWYDFGQNSCVLSVWLRLIGFTLFHGSILLKIYRNLQEYRVRKAHHVLIFWLQSSAYNFQLWESSWPQCPMDEPAQLFAACELIILLYGMSLCYKARSSNWVERYQFTVAVALEALINSAESNHRNLTYTSGIAIGGANSGGRAHPSLAKLRDNLINGTIDFAEVPIAEMNPEDIRAELKRVYTQLRMFKMKNIYQDNPHITKDRKGRAKKIVDKTTGKNRRISVPPMTSASITSPVPTTTINISAPPIPSNTSPKIRRMDEEDEKSDLTVESAPHNALFYSTRRLVPLDANDHSIRV